MGLGEQRHTPRSTDKPKRHPWDHRRVIGGDGGTVVEQIRSKHAIFKDGSTSRTIRYNPEALGDDIEMLLYHRMILRVGVEPPNHEEVKPDSMKEFSWERCNH